MDRMQELELISKIYDRANDMGIVAPSQNPKYKKMNFVIDFDNAHQDVGLNLEGLLAADDFNFSHDVRGIQSNMNRMTGKLENFFIPRYAKQYADVNAVVEKAVQRAQEQNSANASRTEIDKEI